MKRVTAEQLREGYNRPSRTGEGIPDWLSDVVSQVMTADERMKMNLATAVSRISMEQALAAAFLAGATSMWLALEQAELEGMVQ